ncbi:helix-turn-helix transcriptional regulator [Thalassotalea sp. ND16A]|uniref:helix-turn-helix transcriptional regulator n=1 Tax=Thalassotalea sp. ND16A TaxID=1535422 RepID=UPI00051A5B0E|nr:LuxR C-terminal-related transcriptional regulator [Thalassotalea sp. ND16A]KGK01600.1 hypothetical protein ND16A_2949 [Thalassotalea sp. ND16A]
MDAFNSTNKTQLDLPLTNTKLSSLIGDIYGCALSNNWTHALKQIIEITKSNKAFLYMQKIDEPKPQVMNFQTNFDFDPKVLLEYQKQTFNEPYYKVTKEKVEGEAFCVNDYIDIDLYKDSYIYQNIYKPLRSYHCLGGVLIRDGKHDSVWAINRGETDSAYADKYLNFMKVITPHMSRAMHIFKTLKIYKDYASISKSILDQSDNAIIVCEQNGNVIIANDFANKQLEQSTVVNFDCKGIIIRDSIYNRMLQQYIESCSSYHFSNIETQQTIVINNEVETLLITVAPIKNESEFNDINVPCCLVTINFQNSINWPLIVAEFALTPKESQLLQAVYSKKKLNDLVSILGVSYNTLRCHLQSIFKKAGVNSQTDLMIKINLFKS